jgi:hypothetical protein
MTKHRDGTHMLIGALRKTPYGPSFAKGCADNERLSDALAKDASLRRVILDYGASSFVRANGVNSVLYPTSLVDRVHVRAP